MLINPVQLSPYDVWASEDLVDIIKHRQNIADGNPKSYFCISRKITSTSLSKEVTGVLEEYSLPVRQ